MIGSSMRQHRRVHLAAALGAFAVLIPTAASAVAAPYVPPSTRTERVYFKCPADDDRIHTTEPPVLLWNTSKPTKDFVAEEGGCAIYDNAVQVTLFNIFPDPRFTGTFAGNVNSITVILHNAYAGRWRVARPFVIWAELWIENVNVYASRNAGAPGSWDGAIKVTPIADANGYSERMAFTFTGIKLMTEQGDGDTWRRFYLQVGGVDETQSLWLADAADAPSGLIFNPKTPEATKVKVTM